MRAAPFSWLALAALLAACSSAEPAAEDAPRRRSELLDGTGFTMREIAHDGTRPLADDGTLHEVDANSRLVLSFAVAGTDDLAAAGPDWTLVRTGIDRIAALVEEARAVDALTVDETDAAAIAAATEQVQQYYRGLGDFVGEFRALQARLRPDLEVNTILTGAFDGDRQRDFLGNIARWLHQELQRLRIEARDRVAGRERVRVLVQAYHDPRFGDRTPVHVDNYDSLPIGDLRPIDRTGLRLSPQERARLRAELDASTRAAAAIRDVQENGRSFLRALGDSVEQLRRAASTLARSIRTAGDWRAQLDAALAPLRQFAAATQDQAAKDAAEEVAEALTALVTALGELAQQSATGQTLDEIVAGLRRGDAESVLGLMEQLRAVVEGDLTTALQAFEREGARLRAAVQELERRVTPADLATLLPPAVRTTLAELPQQLPAAFAFVQFVRDRVIAGRKRQTVAKALKEGGENTIPRALDDLPDATVDLTRVGVDLGDRIGVQVRFELPDTDPPRTLDSAAFDSEMVLTGLHRRIGGKLIFARADGGPDAAQQWKANVAAVASWHYRCRDARTDGGAAFWNGLDPGLGVHVASLDQGDDNAEVGIGANVSLFGGFLTGGVGYNLAAEENGTYYFVGIDLLDVLRQTGSAVGVR
ncbi:MAG: hypothetical protein AB7O97_05990 [Planctomycetota bacterium]